MTTIKSYTDLEQSKKLAEILPLESADGFWEYHNKWCSEGDEWEGYEDYPRAEPYLEYTRTENEWKEDKSDVPCWSLATLINVIPQEIFDGKYIINITEGINNKWVITYSHCENRRHSHYELSTGADNIVDACYETIIKLHELNLLWL